VSLACVARSTQGTSDVWIRELLNLSRSARLQEALSAYPRACRDRLEVMRESVLTRLNFLRRARSMRACLFLLCIHTRTHTRLRRLTASW
jgi:hypothetical protein